MGQIYNLFSHAEPPPSTHTLSSANALLPIISKITEETIKKTEKLAIRIQRHPKGSGPFETLVKEYDLTIHQWSEKIHRLGAVAKGLWLVDFDTGKGYLCWSYPEKKIEYFHTYDTGFKQRVKYKPTTGKEAEIPSASPAGVVTQDT
jgi:hypothetical protein